MIASQKLTSEMLITSKTIFVASISFHITYIAQLFWFIWAWHLRFCVTGACTADVDNTAVVWTVKMNGNNVIRNIIKCSILNGKILLLKASIFRITSLFHYELFYKNDRKLNPPGNTDKLNEICDVLQSTSLNIYSMKNIIPVFHLIWDYGRNHVYRFSIF